MALIAFVSASSIKLEKPEPIDEELGRYFYTTNSMGSFLALNSTVLYLGVGALLIGAGAILGIQLRGGNIPFRSLRRAYERYAYEPSHEHTYYGDQNEYETRYKRSAFHDIASKMAQLEQAFKKYQVEEAECEMYIACEASQVQRIEENGPLARIVYDILSTFNRSKDGHKWDDRMDGLVKAFEFGTGASASGQVDPCQPLRNKCFELHAKY